MKPTTMFAALAASIAIVVTLPGCDSYKNSDPRGSSTAPTPMSSAADASTQTDNVPPAMQQSASAATGTAGEDARQDVAKAADPSADRGITAKIRALLLAEPGLKSMQINVQTQNGVAVLSGSVDTTANSWKAEQLARTVEGVKSVENRMMVKAQPVG